MYRQTQVRVTNKSRKTIPTKKLNGDRSYPTSQPLSSVQEAIQWGYAPELNELREMLFRHYQAFQMAAAWQMEYHPENHLENHQLVPQWNEIFTPQGFVSASPNPLDQGPEPMQIEQPMEIEQPVEANTEEDAEMSVIFAQAAPGSTVPRSVGGGLASELGGRRYSF